MKRSVQAPTAGIVSSFLLAIALISAPNQAAAEQVELMDSPQVTQGEEAPDVTLDIDGLDPDQGTPLDVELVDETTDSSSVTGESVTSNEELLPETEDEAITIDPDVSAQDEPEDVVADEASISDEAMQTFAPPNEDAQLSAQATDWKVAEECVWRIDENGTLIIKPANGTSGSLPNYDTTDPFWLPEWTNKEYRDKITSVRVEGQVKCGWRAAYLFYQLSNATTMDLSGLDTNLTSKLNFMFSGCSSLRSVDLSSIKTYSLRDMVGMFQGCTSLKSIDLSAFDLRKVVNYYAAFDGCTSLETWKTGTGYTIMTAPPATAGNGKWWSYGDQKWVTPSEIANNRRKIADTYTSTTKALSVQYFVHRQTYGWEKQWSKKNGAQSGTTGQSKRLEGIRIRLAGDGISGGISYRTHVQRIGWQGWKSNGAMSGTTGKSLRLEAIEIKLTGEMANRFDVYYRVHAQKFGWMAWAKNGQSAGTAGYSYRLEAIQIVLVPKGGKTPPTTYKGASVKTVYRFLQKR